jgi:hypothetical protein
VLVELALTAVGGSTEVANPVDADRPGDVFDLLLAEILKDKRNRSRT